MDRGKLVQRYQTAAVLLLNTLVLTVIVLLALHFIFPLERSIWKQNLEGRRLSDDLVPAHYYLTDAAETERIRQTLDDYVLQGHWQVNPWTGLINRAYASEYLNVDQDGRRAGLPPSAEHSGLPPLDVWAFGGSTLFGWGVSDRHTVPSQLQAELQERLPRRQVSVSNLGVPWYNSSHEVALLLARLRQSSRPPDMVVFLDGLNDLIHRAHYHTESPLHHQLDRAWEERLDAMFAPPPWIRLTPSFPLFRLAPPAGSTLGGVESQAGGGDEQAWLRQAAAAHRTNRRAASAICEEFGVTAFFFLQPVPMWLNETRNRTADERYETFVRMLLDGDESGSVSDQTGALADLDSRYAMTVEEVGVHYSDVAGQVLAAAMADAMMGVQPSSASDLASDSASDAANR